VQVALGNLAAARKAYQEALDLGRALVAADPTNARWQRDLAMRYGRMAIVETMQGARDHALRSFHEGKNIVAHLMQRSPDSANLPTDLEWFDTAIAALK
jgi:hypothetical protein